MQHIFKQGNEKKPVFLMLHGTGGDENSLLALAEIVDPEASVLSVRGNVLENGMPRFFRRIADGVFDMEDLAARTKELYEFLNVAAEQYNFSRNNIIAIGYSNGANIAANLLYVYNDALKGAILHHPMVPNRDAQIPQQQTKVFIAAGSNDPMCSPQEAIDLQAMLSQHGSAVTLEWETNGHQLTMNEVQKAKTWYEQNFA